MQMRGRDAGADRGDEVAAAGFTQVGKADRDDQKCFEPFAQGDDERLEYG